MRKNVKYYAIIIFGLPMLYFVFAFILGHTPIHNGFKPDTAGIEIFVKSNGAHTDFILPISTHDYNWSGMVSTENTQAKDTAMQFVAMGWGNKDFFLNTPEWSDLKLSTAFNALFTRSDAAMHVSFRKAKPKTGEECKAVMISHEQYTALVSYIGDSFVKDSNGKVIQIAGAYYGKNDAFFEANSHYHLFKTCNEWTRKGLSHSKIRCAVWSVMDKSVLRFLD